MRCSNCNGDVRGVVVLDIDGTLARWHEGFLQFLDMYLPPEQLAEMHKNGRIRTWSGRDEFRDRLGLDLHTYQSAKLAFRQSGLKRSLVPYRFASELAHWARTLNTEIWITTTRPWLSLDNVDPDTREWLRRHGVQYDHLLFDEDKIARLVERVDPTRILMVLDNEPDIIRRCEELDIHSGVLRLNQWNLGFVDDPSFTKVDSLMEATSMLRERAGAFNELQST